MSLGLRFLSVSSINPPRNRLAKWNILPNCSCLLGSCRCMSHLGETRPVQDRKKPDRWAPKRLAGPAACPHLAKAQNKDMLTKHRKLKYIFNTGPVFSRQRPVSLPACWMHVGRCSMVKTPILLPTKPPRARKEIKKRSPRKSTLNMGRKKTVWLSTSW